MNKRQRRVLHCADDAIAANCGEEHPLRTSLLVGHCIQQVSRPRYLEAAPPDKEPIALRSDENMLALFSFVHSSEIIGA